MHRLVAPAFCLILLGASPGHGDIVLNAGNHTLLPNTATQTIDVHVTGDELIIAFDLVAQLGDGTGPNPEPIFTAVDFTGSILDLPGAVVSPGPLSGIDQFASASISLDGGSPAVLANGFLVRLTIDTTGLDEGVYPILLTMTEFGFDSAFLDELGNLASAEFGNGSITIAPAIVDVPEAVSPWQWLCAATAFLAAISQSRALCKTLNRPTPTMSLSA